MFFVCFILKDVHWFILCFLIPTKTAKQIKAKGVVLIVDDLRTEGISLNM